MKKTFFLALVLALSTVLFAGGKAYDVIFSAPTTVGNVKLAPGSYTVKVEGANAVFTSTEHSKSVTTPVKVETGTKKFSFTAVDSSRQGDVEVVNAIELGGSTTKLEFTK